MGTAIVHAPLASVVQSVRTHSLPTLMLPQPLSSSGGSRSSTSTATSGTRCPFTSSITIVSIASVPAGTVGDANVAVDRLALIICCPEPESEPEQPASAMPRTMGTRPKRVSIGPMISRLARALAPPSAPRAPRSRRARNPSRVVKIHHSERD